MTFDEWVGTLPPAPDSLDSYRWHICKMAWDMGAMAEREACAKLVKASCRGMEDDGFALAQLIKARGEE